MIILFDNESFSLFKRFERATTKSESLKIFRNPVGAMAPRLAVRVKKKKRTKRNLDALESVKQSLEILFDYKFDMRQSYLKLIQIPSHY